MVEQLSAHELGRIAKVIDLGKSDSPISRYDKNLVRVYFNDRLSDDFVRVYLNDRLSDNFTRLNDGVLRICSYDARRGYTFAEELQLNRDHESRMEEELRIHRALGLFIIQKFVDYQEGISGFSWVRE